MNLTSHYCFFSILSFVVISAKYFSQDSLCCYFTRIERLMFFVAAPLTNFDLNFEMTSLSDSVQCFRLKLDVVFVKEKLNLPCSECVAFKKDIFLAS